MNRTLSRRCFLAQLGAGSLVNLAKAKEEEPVPAIETVDAHVHVWKRDPRYPWAAETKNPPTDDATAERLLTLMQAAGVKRTVIIQVIHYRWDNRYVADTLKTYPQFFRGVARVNPEDPAAPDQLERLTKEDRFHGVRLSPAADAAGDWIRGALMPPLWKKADDLGVPMTVLTPVARLPDLIPLLDRFPNLTVVIDHMADSPLARPQELEKLLALRRYPKLFVKVSHTWSLSAEKYPYADAQTQVRRLYEAFGAQRLIAGSDWPLVEKYCSYAEAIDLARARWSFLNIEDRRWVCGRTAQRVWQW